MRLPGSKIEEPVPAPSADFAHSENKGLQLGQNLGTVEASFYSDAIQGINIAAGASVYMGEHKTVEDKILDVLIAGDPQNRSDIRQAEPGTCEWILDHASFRNWLQKDPSVTAPLYIQGIPGSGKSVLLKFLVKELEKRLCLGSASSSPVDATSPSLGASGKTIAVACFCDDKNEHRRTPIWILRTLLYRLFHQNRNLVKHVQKHISVPNDMDALGSDPDEFQSVDVLHKILKELILDPEVEVVYFVVDGLDQCGPHLPAVLQMINDLSTAINGEANQQGQPFSLRCIVSDRGGKIVRDKMLPEYTIDMPTDNQRDIDHVTDNRVKRIQEYRYFSDTVVQTTTNLLKQNSKGMFMWLSLVLDDLGTWEGVWTETNIEKKLHSIPSDVEAFYMAMLERQPRDSVKRLRALLMWVYFAARPLSLRELNVVLTLQDNGEYEGGDSTDEEIDALRINIEGHWSALFAVQDGIVHLAHQSVKDFLSGVFSDDSEQEYPRFGLARKEAQRSIASTCLAYLHIKEVHQRAVPEPPVDADGMIDETQLLHVRQQYLTGFPFLDYCVKFVGHHLQESKIEEETDVKGMKEFFAADSAALASWAPAYDLLKRWTSGKYSGSSSSTSLLFVAARLNLPWLANQSTRWVSYTSLPSAIRAPDRSGWSAIHIAADSESVEMVKWLLKEGAFVDAETLGLSHPGRTALHFAASKRSDAGPRMVHELLEHGAKATANTRQGGNSPLHYAVDSRSVETIKALLNAGADPNAASSSGLTPLHRCAAIPGLEGIVEALLEGGADPNQKTSVGALSAVRGLSGLKASRDLWQTYYAVNTSQTALHIAAKAKDAEQTVKVLLAAGADADARDSAGRTPLHVAVVKMEPEAVTKLLVEAVTDVNARDVDGKTPLLMLLITITLQAAQQPEMVKEGQASKERMIDLLLSAGADPHAEGKDKQSPISWAMQAKLQWAVDLLTQERRGDDEPDNESSQQPIASPKDIANTKLSNRDGESKIGFLGTQASRWLPKRSMS
ncbi:skeletrophin [Aspergillus affinis]|uniref:skeletrophin n=1 Tax=Aspergillus affinis TaxID=1070780 RepID=UPI0022FF373A|nr:skeletrophin [Aspergillus affinis]KAI9043656.1 skeletrophin [Aspergillus affinis]